MRIHGWLRVVIVVVAGLLGLGSCGGGGGSGFRVSFDVADVSFRYLEGESPGFRIVAATAHGNPPASGLFVGAIVSGEGIEQPINITLDEEASKAYASIAPMYGLAPGHYEGTVQLLACADQWCGKHFSGSPHSVSYSIDVLPLLRASPVSVNLTAFERATGTSSTLAVTLADGDVAANVSVSYAAGASGWLQVANDGSALTLTPDASALLPGNYAATLQLNSQDASQMIAVPVSLVVAYDPALHLHVDKSSLAFAATETENVATQTLQLSLPAGEAAVSTSLTYASGASGWLQVQNNGSSLALTPSVSGLTPGVYTAALAVMVSNPADSLNIPVSFTVSRGLTVPATVSATLTSDSSGTGEFGVVATPGVSLAQWTASSSAPWLVIDTPNGAMNGPLKWRVDPALFGTLANNASHQASITVGGNGLTSVVTQVSIRKQFTEISHIDSMALLAGGSGDVLLYGKGFASVSDFGASLQLGGGLVPANVTVLSDSVASLSLQSVPAGNYSVMLGTVMGALTRISTLRVLPPRSYPYQAIGISGRKGAIVWDGVSESAYATDLEVGRIHRFGWNGTAFVHTTATLGTPVALGMDRDRQHLLVSNTNGDLQRLNPSTLALQSSTNVGANLLAVAPLPLVITGDNRVWMAQAQPYGGSWGQLLEYDLDRGVGQLRTGNQFQFYNGPWGYPTPDGRRMLMTQSSGISPAKPLVWMDIVSNVLSVFPAGTTPDYFTWAATDRKGSRWLLGPKKLYDFSLNVLGNLAVPTGWTFVHGVLSRDGSRAYLVAYADGAVYLQNNYYAEPTSAVKPRIFVVDTSALPPAETSFPVVGYFDFDHYPGCRSVATCDPVGRSTISEDGKTLFIMGERNFMAVPIPDDYVPGGVPSEAMPVGASITLRKQKQLPFEWTHWRLGRSPG